MRVMLIVVALLASPVASSLAEGRASPYEEDFAELLDHIESSYAYLNESRIDVAAVGSRYRPLVAAASGEAAFLRLVKDVADELHDHHVTVHPAAGDDRRFVPSTADLWAEWIDGEAVITAVRARSRAAELGFRPGMRVERVDGEAVEAAVSRELPLSQRETTAAARDWALRACLAGRLDAPVRVEAVDESGRRIDATFAPGSAPAEKRVIVDRVGPGVGYVRFGNSLGDTRTIGEFDAALEELRGTRALVIDLRNTPSGGNTTVARGILSRLTATERPYQRHRLSAEEREYGVAREWVELVVPRGPFAYEGEVVVLVGRWTGSMGEGLAIGLDAFGATVIGGPMARLRGATRAFRLENSGVEVYLPVERLFHVDGSPREAFVPKVLVAETGAPHLSEGDLALAAALDELGAAR